MAGQPRQRWRRCNPVAAWECRGVRLIGQNIWHALPGLAGSRIQAEAFRSHAQGTAVELEEFLPALQPMVLPPNRPNQ